MPCEAGCSAGSSSVRGNFGEKFASQGHEDKITHVGYFWSQKVNSLWCVTIVRIELSLVNQASNKNKWHSDVTSVASEFLLPMPS